MARFQDPVAAEVFGNDLVWRCLGGYLGPGDLKDCRLVCKTFDKNVKGLTKSYVLHLSKDNWSDLDFLSKLDLGPSSGINAVKVTLSGSGLEETTAIQNLPDDIFKNMKSLAIEWKEDEQTNGGYKLFLWEEGEGEDQARAVASGTLAAILGLCSSQLVSLSLQIEMTPMTNFSVVVSCSKALERLKGLKTLELSQNDKKEKWPVFPFRLLSFTDGVSYSDSMGILAGSLESLEDLVLTLKENPFSGRSLRTLLERRAPFLKKLELGETDAIRNEELDICSLVFPQLSHLSLRIFDTGHSKLCSFLANQPSLQGLTLKIQGSLTQALLAVIGAKSGRLSTLELKCRKMEEDLDFHFLRDFGHLRVFSLITQTARDPFDYFLQRRGRVGCCYIEDVLRSLPSGVRILSLRSGWNAPLTTRYELEEVFKDPKFCDLEELSILLIPFAVRDPVLEVLGSRSRFPKMRKLHISHSYHFSGDLKGDRAFWAGLRDISFRQVLGLLQENSLTEKLEGSKELRKLTLRDIPTPINFPSSAADKIVRSSKSLETFFLNNTSPTAGGLDLDLEDHLGPGPFSHRLKKATEIPQSSANEVEEVDSDSDAEEGLACKRAVGQGPKTEEEYRDDWDYFDGTYSRDYAF